MKIRSPLLAALMVAGLMGATAQQAQAAAVAQSYLNIEDFTINFSTVPNTISGVSNTTDTFADYNGITSTTKPTAAVGPDAGLYAPGTAYTPNPATDDYAGAFSEITGSVLSVTGAASLVDSTVVLASPGDGSAQANSGVSASLVFDFVLGETSTMTADLLANAFIRTDLDQDNTFAQSSIGWIFSLRNAATGEFFTFNPAELNQTLAITGATGEDEYTLDSTAFQFVANLGAGTWQGNIRHTAASDASWTQEVPEPASLALLGLGLLGLGAVRGRKQAA